MINVWNRLAVFAVALIPLVYALPIVGIGLGDLHAIRHLDEGEFTILRAWKDVYVHSPFYAGPFDPLHIYPKAFYNLAGLFLYPYSWVEGADYRVVVVVWRIMNACFGSATVVMLFFLIRRVFRSDLVGVVTAGLFAVTPEFLLWVSNVRPNPLEQLLTFAVLYCSVRLAEAFSSRIYLLAALLGGVAFASKYGGMHLIILVPFLTVFFLWRRNDPQEMDRVLLGQAALVRQVFPPLLLILFLSLCGFSYLLYKSGGSGATMFLLVSQASFSEDFLPGVLRKLEKWNSLLQIAPWLVVAGLLCGLGFLKVMWSMAKRWQPVPSFHQDGRVYGFIYVSLLLQFACVYLFMFFLSGPAYLVHPNHLFSQVGYMIYYTVLGGSFGGAVMVGPLERLGALLSEVPGWQLLSILVCITLHVFLRSPKESSKEQNEKGVLGLYVLISFVVFLGTGVSPTTRHVLPAVGLLYAFVVAIPLSQTLPSKWKHSSKVLQVSVIGLLLGFAGTNVAAALEDWDGKRHKATDVGFQVGEWLRKHYSSDTSILTDHWTFYTPPEFKNVSTTTFVEWKGKTPQAKYLYVINHIKTLAPKIVILADMKRHKRVVELELMLKSESALKELGYHLVRTFTDPVNVGRFENVRVFERGAL